MNELAQMVSAMKKLIRNQDRDLLDIYVDNLKKGELNVSRIMADEMQDYFKEHKGESENMARLSALSDELYNKTMEYYEANTK